MSTNQTKYGLKFIKLVSGFSSWQEVADYLNDMNHDNEILDSSLLQDIANGKKSPTKVVNRVVHKELVKCRHIDVNLPEEIEQLHNSAKDATPANIYLAEKEGIRLLNKHLDPIEQANIYDALSKHCYIASRNTSDDPDSFIRDIESSDKALKYAINSEARAKQVTKYESREEGKVLQARAAYNQAAILNVRTLETSLLRIQAGDDKKNIISKIEKNTSVMRNQLETLVKIPATKEYIFSYSLSIALPIYEIYKALGKRNECDELSKFILEACNSSDEPINFSRNNEVKWLLNNDASDSIMNCITKIANFKKAA